MHEIVIEPEQQLLFVARADVVADCSIKHVFAD